jgi:DNA-binding transcriptional LysR family regulator
MEMQQIRYFLAMVEELNFTRAAEKCGVSQPSLSRAIRLLEEELGGALFHRERDGTHLTELGRMVRPYLEMVHGKSLEAKRLSQDISGPRTVPLRLGIMSTISPAEIVDLIAAIRTHRGIELKVCDASAQDLRKRVVADDLDAVIYALPGESPEETTHSVPLFRERMVIAVHEGHRLAKQASFPVRELNGESYIHRVNCEFAGYADHILAEQGVTCTPAYWSERDDWTLAMVAAGLGFGFMPANSVSHPRVVGLPIVEPEFWRVVKLVTVRGRPQSPAVGALVREAVRKSWFGKPALAAGA